jgi:hypothetical protein
MREQDLRRAAGVRLQEAIHLEYLPAYEPPPAETCSATRWTR